jgi:hypothetical protein
LLATGVIPIKFAGVAVPNLAINDGDGWDVRTAASSLRSLLKPPKTTFVLLLLYVSLDNTYDEALQTAKDMYRTSPQTNDAAVTTVEVATSSIAKVTPIYLFTSH